MKLLSMRRTVFSNLEVKMINKSVFVVVLLATLAVGCTVNPHGVKVKSPSLEIGLSGGSGHCPPGQAKKGNC